MDQMKPRKFPVVVWTPFFDRGKFRYWKNVGRGACIIGKDGFPRTEFYNDAHATGGSIWTRVLPEGETPEGQPGDNEEQPQRPQSGHPSDDESDL